MQGAENQNNQSSNSSTDQLSTDNWKTYRNSEYGFKFNYPANWHPHARQREGFVTLAKTEELPSIKDCSGQKYQLHCVNNYIDQIDIGVFDLVDIDDKEISKEEYIKENFSEDNFGGDDINVKKWANINKLEMLRVEQGVSGKRNKLFDFSDKNKSDLQYLYFKDGKVYIFYLSPYEPTSGSVSAENYKDFEKIVSTFRFTDSPMDSLIYLISEYYFEFYYFLLPMATSLIISLFLIYKRKIRNFWLFLVPIFLCVPFFLIANKVETEGNWTDAIVIGTIISLLMFTIIIHSLIVAPYVFKFYLIKKTNA